MYRVLEMLIVNTILIIIDKLKLMFTIELTSFDFIVIIALKN